MTKQIMSSLALLSLFITFSGAAHAQFYDPCSFVPLDELAQCLAENGGGGSPQVPNQPAVTYALGTTGDVYISTNERIYEGIPSKIHLVKSGSAQVEVIKIFPLGTRVNGFKISGDKLIYILQSGNGYASTSVKSLSKDSLGNYVETSFFEELNGSIQGEFILSYMYSGLTIVDGFAYVIKTTYTYAQQEQVCVGGLGCLENNDDPVFVSLEEIIYKQGLTSPAFDIVSSLPGAPTQSSRFSFSILADNIYRTDSQTGLTTLWLQNNNQAGHNLQKVGVSEEYLLFRSTSGLNDITTNLIAARIADDVPIPELRLATDLAGIVFLAYQVVGEEEVLKIEIGQTNVDELNPVFGKTIVLQKTAAVRIEGVRVGDVVKLYLKINNSEPTIIVAKTLSNEDFSTDNGAYLKFKFADNFQLPSTTDQYKMFVRVSEKKSNEELIVIEKMPKLNILLVKVKSPFSDCLITAKGVNKDCYRSTSENLFSSVIANQVPFAYSVFPYEEDSNLLNFIGPVVIEGNLPLIPEKTSYYRDYESITKQMIEKNCQRAVVIVDHSYLDYGDHQAFLNPIFSNVPGVASGKLAFVTSSDWNHLIAHELSHTLGIEHTNIQGTSQPNEGFSMDNLLGFNTKVQTSSDQFIVPKPTINYMWGKAVKDVNQNIIKAFWTQYSVHSLLTYAIQSNVVPISLAPQYYIALTGFLGNDDTFISAETRIVYTSASDPQIPGSQFKAVSLDKFGNQVSTTGIRVDFSFSRFNPDPDISEEVSVNLDKVPVSILIPYNDRINEIEIQKGELSLATVPPTNERFSLFGALSRIPDNAFLKDQNKSRDELEKNISHVESAKSKRNFKEALAQLQVLLQKSSRLIKKDYTKTPLQISKQQFDLIIEREIDIMEKQAR